MTFAELRARLWSARQARRVGVGRLGAFGDGSAFEPPAIVLGHEHIFIGERVFFHSGAWLSVVSELHGRRYDPRLEIGDRCVFGRDLVIACVGQITIGAEVLASDRVFIGDTHHEFQDPDVSIIDQPMAAPAPVVIGDGAFLGIGACVLPGVTIGARAFVGANAVVTGDLPANCVAAGSPARVLQRWDPGARTWSRQFGGPAPSSATGGAPPAR